MTVTISGTSGITYPDAVTQATAFSAAIGAVGSLAFLTTKGTNTYNPGDSCAGSALWYCNAAVGGNVNGTDSYYNTSQPSGTWRCLGYVRPFYNCSATLFIRIA